MARLTGKVAIITGAARGQGAAEASLFIEEGAKVVITDLLVEEGTTLGEKLGDNALFIQHDVTKSNDWEKVINTTVEKFGSIDILVNNAGIGMRNLPVEETTEEDYMQAINVNQVSVFLGMKHVVPTMKKQGSGSIVNISSLAGISGIANGIGYTASKFAVRGMTKTVALEVADLGIRVNSVHPGFIDTPMIQTKETADFRESAGGMIPMKRLGQSEDVAKLVLFLGSDDSSYSTGAEYILDGGLNAQT